MTRRRKLGIAFLLVAVVAVAAFIRAGWTSFRVHVDDEYLAGFATTTNMTPWGIRWPIPAPFQVAIGRGVAEDGMPTVLVSRTRPVGLNPLTSLIRQAPTLEGMPGKAWWLRPSHGDIVETLRPARGGPVLIDRSREGWSCARGYWSVRCPHEPPCTLPPRDPGTIRIVRPGFARAARRLQVGEEVWELAFVADPSLIPAISARLPEELEAEEKGPEELAELWGAGRLALRKPGSGNAEVQHALGGNSFLIGGVQDGLQDRAVLLQMRSKEAFGSGAELVEFRPMQEPALRSWRLSEFDRDRNGPLGLVAAGLDRLDLDRDWPLGLAAARVDGAGRTRVIGLFRNSLGPARIRIAEILLDEELEVTVLGEAPVDGPKIRPSARCVASCMRETGNAVVVAQHGPRPHDNLHLTVMLPGREAREVHLPITWEQLGVSPEQVAELEPEWDPMMEHAGFCDPQVANCPDQDGDGVDDLLVTGIVRLDDRAHAVWGVLSGETGELVRR